MRHTDGDATTSARRTDRVAQETDAETRTLLNRDARTSDLTCAERILYECPANGLSLKVSAGHVLTLSSPLTSDEDDLARIA